MLSSRFELFHTVRQLWKALDDVRHKSNRLLRVIQELLVKVYNSSNSSLQIPPSYVGLVSDLRTMLFVHSAIFHLDSKYSALPTSIFSTLAAKRESGLSPSANSSQSGRGVYAASESNSDYPLTDVYLCQSLRICGSGRKLLTREAAPAVSHLYGDVNEVNMRYLPHLSSSWIRSS